MDEKKTIHLTIDDKECTCDYGEYLYDVATRNGIFIPTLCRHEAFDDHRACCRVCVVEVVIKGRGKVVTSCVYPVERDCAVYTNNDKIKEQRAVICSLLSKRAPDSDRICEMAEHYEGDKGFERLIHIDNEKCILCGLCVQACDSLGTGAISTVNRGTDKAVGTPYGKSSPACIGCLSCANICPTEAITFTETERTRTIWEHEFELVVCEECGEVMGTRESVAHAAAGVEQDIPVVCDECRRKILADEMAQTYAPL